MKKLLLFFLLYPFIFYGQIQIGNNIDGETAGDMAAKCIISGNGNVVAIGSNKNDSNGTDSGHVRIFENLSGTWTQIGNDIDGESAGDGLGFSISLSNDGTIIAIGAHNNDGNGTDSGHVRIFENQSGIWVQIGNDIDSEATGDLFGYSVSLSGNGSIVTIGAIYNDDNGTNSGHVRIYQNQSGNWTQIGNDIDGEAAWDYCGSSVSLNDDGNIVAIGAFLNDGSLSGSSYGHVRIYENLADVWTQIGNDIDGEAAADSADKVSLSNDGSIVAIGAYSNDGNGENSGHVRIYENQSGNWVQIGNDIEGEAAGDFSGSVSLSANGNVVAIGAWANDGNGTNSGHVRIYQNQSGTWVQIGNDIDGEAIDDRLGAVSLSSDGGIVAVGASRNDGNGLDSGHVRVYDLSAVLSTESQSFSSFSLYPNPTKHQFTIQLENNTELQAVRVYNNLGQLVLTSKESTVNISSFSAGSYVIEIATNQGKDLKKLIIE